MRREMEISEKSVSSSWSELSITTSTSAALRPLTPWPPAKITSCIDWPRTASGLCSPSAHSTASVMFDLPLPFGPTTTLMPGPKVRPVRSGKDLKPFIVIDFRCMAYGTAVSRSSRVASAVRAASCSDSFLERPLPVPSVSPPTSATVSNSRS